MLSRHDINVFCVYQCLESDLLSSYTHMHSAHSWFLKIPKFSNSNCVRNDHALIPVVHFLCWRKKNSWMLCRYGAGKCHFFDLKKDFELAFKKHWPSLSSWMIYFAKVMLIFIPIFTSFQLQRSMLGSVLSIQK